MERHSKPDDEHEENPPKEDRKIPEFIILDRDTDEESPKIGATPHDSQQMFGSIQSISKTKHPLYLRLLAFIGTFVMIILSTIVFLVFLVVGLLSLLLLGQSKHMNNQAAIAWRSFKKALVFTLGAFVCIFNLSLGIGIVLMYFLLLGEKFNSRIMQEFTKQKM